MEPSYRRPFSGPDRRELEGPACGSGTTTGHVSSEIGSQAPW
jgi:hypothetical protein